MVLYVSSLDDIPEGEKLQTVRFCAAICVEVDRSLVSECESIMGALEHHFPRASLFLSTDTAFSECCTDFITAAHVQADAIVKFGFSCIFCETGDVPLYVVSWKPRLSSQLQDTTLFTSNSHTIFVYDVPLATCNNGFEAWTWQSLDTLRPSVETNIISCHREPWVGEVLCLLAPHNKVYQVSQNSSLLELNCARVKSRRWRLISSLNFSPIYGIVIHSSMSHASALARSLCDLLLSRGHQYYLINAGVLTPTKLGNYPDIDVFVIVGCAKLCFASQDFFKPVLTCFELLCQLDMYQRTFVYGLGLTSFRANFWEDPYTLDAQKIESIISLSKQVQTEENRDSSLALYAERSLELLQRKHEQNVPLEPGTSSQSVSIRCGKFGVPRNYANIDDVSDAVYSVIH